VTRIVTTHYRYKRPPKKRKAVALTGSAIVRKQASADATPPRPAEEPTPAKSPAPGARKSAIVTIKRKSRAPDLSPEELQRRADAADALWHELVRRSTGRQMSLQRRRSASCRDENLGPIWLGFTTSASRPCRGVAQHVAIS